MSDATVVLFFIYALVFGVVCSGVWQSKGGSAAMGFMIGLVFGVLGLVYVAASKPDVRHLMRECPHCRESIRREASVCSRCQRDVDPLPVGKRRGFHPAFVIIVGIFFTRVLAVVFFRAWMGTPGEVFVYLDAVILLVYYVRNLVRRRRSKLTAD